MVEKAQKERRKVRELRTQLEQEAIQFGITGDPRPLLRAAMLLYLTYEKSPKDAVLVDMDELTPTDVTAPMDPTKTEVA